MKISHLNLFVAGLCLAAVIDSPHGVLTFLNALMFAMNLALYLRDTYNKMKLPKDFFEKRPLSYSAISSFEWDPEQWYQSYVMGVKAKSKEMDFGKMIDERIQNDPTFMPSLPRYPLMQHKMKVVFSGIPLVGISDGTCLKDYLLADYKTGKKPWDQARADETGQLTMYLLMLYITEKIKPEQFRCFIHWLPTQDNGDFTVSLTKDCVPVTFETKRTMKDVLHFASKIKETVTAMRRYALVHR